jgi:hypothetical protein
MARKKKEKNVADKAPSAAASATTVIPSDAENVASTAAAATTTMPTPADDNAAAVKPAPVEVDVVKPASTDPPIPPPASDHHPVIEAKSPKAKYGLALAKAHAVATTAGNQQSSS